LRGVGIHHSGVLPVLREVVEILFSDNLLKVLFATETFAMGVNMPAKTVIFTGLRKFDGLSTRHLESGEYIQMSGRAGRRGADSEGVSILMIDDELSLAKCQEMVQGDSAPLYSSSHLSYNMLLNLLRAESGFKPEDVISRSLFRFIIARFFLGRWLRLKVS
jgi:ATP-dependent RNA helicase DOB1